ncbi:MAG TPA: alpha/beta fold hydrolase, partial [Rugosimonospora sp.]|nr:alpha/beta fold hydrolase [Rugosimonospora sp.]
PGGAPPDLPRVTWQPCPQYSDDVIRSRVGDDLVAAYRALLDRMQCGTVSVPLDYRHPAGPHITVAITRLPATDRAHRLGSLALNPGGPGGSGYLMPADVVVSSDVDRHLNDRYDLIGFDPRGVGYSTQAQCRTGGGGGSDQGPVVGPITEAEARLAYDRQAAANAACGSSNAAFLSQITTLNVARDLDRVRAALGEPRLNFLGVSWGTWLGVVYRSAFPQTVGRVFLDSVAIPHFRGDVFAAERAAAAERDFGRMAAWLAGHNDTYGFGTTAARVRTAIRRLVVRFDANPKQYTDLPLPIDGSIIAVSAAQNSRVWPLAAQLMAELRDSTGDTAPPTVKRVLGPGGQQAPPAGAPQDFNPVMGRAAICNEDPVRPDFAAAWAAYRQIQADNPVTGRANPFSAGCAGWPLPAQQYQLRYGTGSLVLSGHLYEAVSVYKWTPQMRSIVGGTVYTVRDDVHGSVLRVPACAADLVAYFDTGRTPPGCAGSPQPGTTPALAPQGMRFARPYR